MTLLERAAALEQTGTNDHVKHIGKQILQGNKQTANDKKKQQQHVRNNNYVQLWLVV
jgi:hypothetical protein